MYIHRFSDLAVSFLGAILSLPRFRFPFYRWLLFFATAGISSHLSYFGRARNVRIHKHARNYRWNTKEWLSVNKINNFAKYSIIFGDRSVSQVMTSTTNAIKVVQVQDISTVLDVHETNWAPKLDKNEHREEMMMQWTCGYLMKIDGNASNATGNQWIWRTNCNRQKSHDWFLMASASMHIHTLTMCDNTLSLLLTSILSGVSCSGWHWHQKLSCTLNKTSIFAIALENQIKR